MPQRQFFALSIVVATILVITIFWPMSPEPDVELTFDEGAQLGYGLPGKLDAPKGEKPTPVASHGVSGSSTEIREVANLSAYSTSTVSKKTTSKSSLVVRVTDALGEPIESGRLELDKRQYLLTAGSSIIAPLEDGRYTLVVSSDGYRDATRTVWVEHTTKVNIELEYTCTFELRLFGSSAKKDPVAGAVVKLWKGRTAARPIKDVISLTACGPGAGDLYKVRVRRTGQGARVTSILSYTQGKHRPGLHPPRIDGRTHLVSNDTIVGLGGCMFDPGRSVSFYPQIPRPPFTPLYTPSRERRSRKLRVWDALSLCGASAPHEVPGSPAQDDFVELVRGVASAYAVVRLPRCPPGRKIVGQTETDMLGRCRFEGLGPGLYCLQAEKGARRTSIITFHPARSSAEAILAESSNLLIQVIRGPGVQHTATVPGAEVHLKSIFSAQSPDWRFLGETGRFGIVRVENVPWGQYEIKVVPPAPLPNQAVTTELRVEEPRQYVQVTVPPGGQRVRGRVLRKDTREPVGQYMLLLCQKEGLGEEVGRVRSNSVGEFVFRNILPGVYELAEEPSANLKSGFVPADTEFDLLMVNRPGGRWLLRQKEIVVKDEDITGLQYSVLPAVKTRFSGAVKNPDGTSAGSGVVLAFQKAVFGFVEPDPVTDSRGHFELTVVGRASESIYTADLTATVLDRIPPHWSQVGPGEMELLSDEAIVYARGRTRVEFQSGDKIDGIEIILGKTFPRKRILVRVLTADGGPVPRMQVFAKQGNLRIPGRPDGQGVYELRGIAPGSFLLVVRSPRRLEFTRRFGWRDLKTYCSEYLSLDMPEDEESLSVEVAVKKSGYLAGAVVDKDGLPLADISVTAIRPDGLTQETWTDVKGLFWIDDVPEDRDCSLRIARKGERRVLAHFDRLKPPIDNIIVRVRE